MGLAFLITTDNLQLLSERKVLKEAEYAALLDASAVVEAARQEARRIEQQARQQAEDSRRQGHEQGLEAARAEYAQQLVGEALAAQRQLQALRAAMAQIVAQAVRQFLGEADPAALLETALRRVDTLVRHEPFVMLRVAPAQEEHVRTALRQLGGELPWAQALAVVADPALPAQACVLQTPSGTLQIGVDAQLDAFRAAVERSGLLQPTEQG
ncbi:type III secretion system stator protein SctL [Roseateles sp. P5_E4]